MSSERSGRRPGESGTKEKILSAALNLFSTRGYGGTTIRGIAEQAQVDPALVHHFYGNKDGVFRAAVESSLDASPLFAAEGDSGDGVPGVPENGSDPVDPVDRFVREHLGYWENPATGAALTAVYRTGLADELASAAFRVKVEAGIDASARRAGLTSAAEPDPAMRLLAAHLIGLGVVRHVLRVEPLASMSYDAFLAWVLPAFRLQVAAQPTSTATTPAARKPAPAKKTAPKKTAPKKAVAKKAVTQDPAEAEAAGTAKAAARKSAVRKSAR